MQVGVELGPAVQGVVVKPAPEALQTLRTIGLTQVAAPGVHAAATHALARHIRSGGQSVSPMQSTHTLRVRSQTWLVHIRDEVQGVMVTQRFEEQTWLAPKQSALRRQSTQRPLAVSQTCIADAQSRSEAHTAPPSGLTSSIAAASEATSGGVASTGTGVSMSTGTSVMGRASAGEVSGNCVASLAASPVFSVPAEEHPAMAEVIVPVTSNDRAR